MAGQRQRQLSLGNTAAVIANRDLPYAAAVNIDRYFSRAGIDTVFEKFLDHRSGTVNDLARSDLIDQMIRELLNRHRWLH